MVRRKSAGRALGAVAVICALLACNDAFACSVCGCGDPLTIAGDARPVGGNWRLALDTDYLTASAASDDNPAAREAVTQYTLRPVVVWSPTDYLSLVLQIPVSRKDWSLRGPDGLELASNTGIGDVEVGARLFVWQKVDLKHLRNQNVAATAGTSLPTGPDDLRVDGQRIDDHAQLGTGGFGPYVGALYAFHQDPWNLNINVNGRIRTTNRFGYLYGMAALWSARFTYRVLPWLALLAGIDGRYAGRDTSSGDLQANTGGLVLSAVPGVSANPVGNVWIHFRAQVPFVTHLFGVQTVGPVFSLSLQYSFAS